MPEITLLAARLIAPPAWTPKFVVVIERFEELDTAPPVRRANVCTAVGFKAAVMFMFPVLVPPKAPIRKVPAVTMFSSALVSESWFTVSLPKSITRELVFGKIDTTPLGAENPPARVNSSESALMEMF